MTQPAANLDFPQNQERFRTIKEPLTQPEPLPGALADWLAKIAARLKAAQPKDNPHDPTP